VVTSNRDVVDSFVVIEPNMNFSDHLPITTNLIMGNGFCNSINHGSNNETKDNSSDDGIRQ